MKNNDVAKFQKIDYGTRVSTSEFTTITVEINPKIIIAGYAKATLTEMSRMNPVRYDSIKNEVNEEKMFQYFSFLISKRVEYVEGVVSEWRSIRQLWMPAWIQFAISCVGEVIIPETGLKFVPVMGKSTMTLDEASAISNILRLFKVDGLSVIDDGFPRTRDGEKDTMSVALIGDGLQGVWPVDHPIYTYVSAFLGFKLMESTTYNLLYRIKYDDINYIAHSLLHDERLFR